MKFLQKKTIVVLLTVTLLVCFMGLLPVQAAAGVPKLPSSEVSYPMGDNSVQGGSAYYVEIKNVSRESDISNLKSSNEKVVSTQVLKGNGIVQLCIYPQKTGTAKITFDAAYGNKTKKLTLKVNIFKYQNPVVKFMIGETDYTSLFKTGEFRENVLTKPVKGKVKVSIKAKSGWKLQKIEIGKDERNMKQIKNNSKINLNRKQGMMAVTMQNKKTKRNIVLKMFIYHEY